MTRILIAIPTFETVATETFKSIFDLKKIPGVDFDLQFVKGYGAARARNLIAKKSQNEKFDYVLMVDSDVILPEDTLVSFSRWFGLNFVMGYYPRKDDKTMSEVYKLGNGFPKSNRLTIEELKNTQADLIDINGGGFGCVFIKTTMFDGLEYPYFKYVEYSDGDCLSEDLYFCNNARLMGYKLYVDPKIGCGHVGKKVVKI